MNEITKVCYKLKRLATDKADMYYLYNVIKNSSLESDVKTTLLEELIFHYQHSKEHYVFQLDERILCYEDSLIKNVCKLSVRECDGCGDCCSY